MNEYTKPHWITNERVFINESVFEKRNEKKRIQPAFFLQNISTFSQGFCTWTLRASAPLYEMQNVLGWRFQISDLKQISQNAEMIISTCALFVEHAYKMISLYLPKPSCNIPFFSLGPYEFFGRIITASYFITSDTKEICNTNEDYSSYEFFPLSSRAQGIFNKGGGRRVLDELILLGCKFI